MERIKFMKEKAKNVKERMESEIERLEQKESDREVELLNREREKVRRQTQIDHDNYLREQRQLQKQKAYEKSDRGRTERARREARMNIQRDREAGLTNEEIRVKYLDSKARIKEFNKQSNKRTKSGLRGAKTFLSDMY